MSLPIPNLDDRRFQDLVDEAKRLIPTYCPEWTNHNVSDPGVALIELFAWMTEMSIFRLNQVPDAFYTHMLNLVGFERFPATAARAELTFWLVGPVDDVVVVPEGTEVATSGDLGEPQVFATDRDLVMQQPTLMAALTSEGAETFSDVWDDLRIQQGSVTCFPSPDLRPGDAFYLGFDDTLAGNVIQLEVRADIEGIGVVPSRPPIRWEVWQGEGWVECDVHLDTTGGLNRDGFVVLLVPAAHEPLTLGGQRAHWLRARLTQPETGQPGYRASPKVRTLAAASIGGTVTAEHSERIRSTPLGQSNGRPDQVFRVEHTPVLPRTPDEVVTVVVGDEVQEWEEVADFIESGPNDRHLVWNSTTGEVHFGPRIRYPDGTSRQHGAVPPEGARIVVTGYRTGGGTQGNVGARTLSSLRSTIPYVARVENLRPATGGVDAETVDNAKKRGPQALRAGARAVTAPDFERLASQADPSIARVRCLPPSEPGRPVQLLLVPAVERAGEELLLDDFALPPTMIERVSTYLDERRILGSTIEVGTPYYQGVTVAALVSARPGRPLTLVRERALSVLYRYLNPLTGGPDGSGWPFDTDLNAASIFQLLEAVEGVERVDDVLLFEYDLRNHERVGFGRDVVRLERNSLFLSANHQVVVR